MSNFKIGKSRFSRFMSGKGFYIALALCLVAIGAAAYIAATGPFGSMVAPSGADSGTASGNTSSMSWDNDSSAQQANTTVSGVEASSSAAASSAASSQTASSQAPVSNAAPTLYVMPVSGTVITAYSGDKPVYDKTMDDYRIHDGIDIAANAGTPVKACADGVVSDIVNDDMYGETVTIKHGGGIVSVYSGLTPAVTVKKGQTVESGDVIGAVGQTAKCEIALTPHLHFAILKDNAYVNPLVTMGKN